MKLRLTRPTARPQDGLLSNIARSHSPGARNVQARIRAVLHTLQQQPHTGPATARRGVRRIMGRTDPYANTDRVGGSEIVILGIRHTSRRPLP